MFPDPEAVIVAYLTGALAGLGDTATATTRIPRDRPARLVRVLLTGSVTRSVSHRDAQVTVECWAPTGPEASSLADLVAHLLTVMDVDGCHVPQGPDGWVGGPYADDDLETGSARYVMTVIVRMRAL